MENQADNPAEIPDFLEAFNINYDPIKNMLITSFGRLDSTGKQYSGDLVVKAAAAKIRNLRPQIRNYSRGRLLLINGDATLAATQTIIACVYNTVSEIAVRDPKLHSPEGQEAYLVTWAVSTERFSIGDILQIDASN